MLTDEARGVGDTLGLPSLARSQGFKFEVIALSFSSFFLFNLKSEKKKKSFFKA